MSVRAYSSIRWVCHSNARSVASTLMRTDQLIAIVREFVDEDVDCIVDDEKTVTSARASILWLTKGFLRRVQPEVLGELRRRQNILCADYVDDMEREELREHIDVFVAASIKQLLHFNSTLSDKRVCLVSHHADPRAASVRCQQSRFSAGYFGELANARYREDLSSLVDFVPVDTRAPRDNWASRLTDYSLHYAVRQPRHFDGFKPFLKGFTAAACDAAIIVPLSESDAMYYLGHDYPFILSDDTLPAVVEMLRYARDSFGGEDWRYASSIMASVRERSSARHVASDFSQFLTIARS